jgi:hypothetical protein
MHVCPGKNVGMQISLCGRVLQERGNLTKKEQQELVLSPPVFRPFIFNLLLWSSAAGARELDQKGATGSVPSFLFFFRFSSFFVVPFFFCLLFLVGPTEAREHNFKGTRGTYF